MSKLGLLSFYLRIEVSRSKTGIEIKQEAYAKKILKETNMEICNLTKCPLEPSTRVLKDGKEKPVDAKACRRIIGCLRYLLHTRPDLSFSVEIAGRYMQVPNKSHMDAIKHILRYVKRTVSYGLKHSRGGSRHLYGYSDSSHGVDDDDDKSSTDYVFYFDDAPVTWLSLHTRVYQERNIRVEHIPGSEQRANTLTKALARVKFGEMQKLLEVDDLSKAKPKLEE
ncbi:secreted RxLR effector protein 161-like [Bidens hawaiensis]|uniref:secreted RxLR effector protein 161-like n=1 Tax=Bidens hawaiensis TaxID=980011 RepID=UPI00404B8C44